MRIVQYMVFAAALLPSILAAQEDHQNGAVEGIRDLTSASHFRLEIIAASSSSRAFNIAEKLNTLLEKPVYIVPLDGLWVVQVGGFFDTREMENAVTKLKGLGINTIRRIEIRGKYQLIQKGQVPGAISSQEPIPIAYAREPIRIDGILDEQAWYTAPVIANFTQSEPHDRLPASEHTEVRILQDDENIYFGFICYDKEPDKIIANEMKRDTYLTNDDYIALYLDTYHDHRNFYNFYTNPRGCLRDAIVTDGRHYNSAWDGIWFARTSITKEGWIAEIRIPFYAIRFAENGKGMWGVNFMRHIRRKRERDYWIPISRDLGFYGAWQASRFGEIEGIRAQSNGRGLEMKPFAVGGVTRQYRPLSTDRQSNQGIDARYSINPNMRAEFSYNTDFAQVEADQEIVNLSRFSIYYPEKREFFLENAGLYSALGASSDLGGSNYLQYFYSRRIGLEDGERIPILGAARLSGKVGGYSLGVLNVQCADKAFINADNQIRMIPGTNFAAVRVKRDIFQQSGVGALVLNKQSFPSRYNRLVAVDALMKFGAFLQVDGNIAKTISPENTSKNYAGEAHVNVLRRSISWRNSYLHIDPHFNPQMGYVWRDDIKRYRSSLFITHWINKYRVRDVSWGLYGGYMTNTLNRFISNYGSGFVDCELSTGDLLSFRIMRDAERIHEGFDIRDIHVHPGMYPEWSREVELESNESRCISGGINIEDSDYWSGKRRDIRLFNGLRPTAGLNMEMFYRFSRVTHPTASFNSNVLSSRVTYSFTTDIFAKSYIQWNELDKKISVNLLMNYRYCPGSDIYLVYNELWDPEGQGRMDIRDRVLLIKLTYLLRI